MENYRPSVVYSRPEVKDGDHSPVVELGFVSMTAPL